MDNTVRARLRVLLSMTIFGSIGTFVRFIPLPSALIAMLRGSIGAPFLLLILFLRRESMDWPSVRPALPRLCLTGMLLGINWIVFFESFRFTTVATATLCYYLAPILLVAASPLVFQEHMTPRKLLCILAALVGMVFVSGVAENGLPALSELKGVLLALAAAFLYATIVILNKKLRGLRPYDRTLVQLAVSALVLLPYNLLSGNLPIPAVSPKVLVLLLLVGVVHTGFAYSLYFGSVEELSSQSLAILSYIDPVVAVLLSAFLLHEPMGMYNIVGAVLILGAALICELPEKKEGSETPGSL